MRQISLFSGKLYKMLLMNAECLQSQVREVPICARSRLRQVMTNQLLLAYKLPKTSSELVIV